MAAAEVRWDTFSSGKYGAHDDDGRDWPTFGSDAWETRLLLTTLQAIKEGLEKRDMLRSARAARDTVDGSQEVTLMDRILRHIEVDRDSVEDWASYPFCITAIEALERLEFDRGVTFLVGENGSGKSTIIEAVAIKAGVNPEGGSKNFRSSYRPSESSLHRALRLARGVRRERSGFFLRAEKRPVS